MGSNGHREDRAAMHLRFGKGLLKRIDAEAWHAGVTRNTWIVEAAEKRLTGRFAARRTTAAELMSDRIPFMVRMPPEVVSLVDEAAGDDGVTRTIWLMDACLSACRPR